MTMYVDWTENYECWENEGRRVLEESCEHEQLQIEGYCNECEIDSDDCQPMMNYAYPLDEAPSDENILKVVKETCLTVMRKDSEYFLALCSGGMDFSQQIGLAYLLLEHWIPIERLLGISTQKALCVHGKNWTYLRENIIDQLATYSQQLDYTIKGWAATEK